MAQTSTGVAAGDDASGTWADAVVADLTELYTNVGALSADSRALVYNSAAQTSLTANTAILAQFNTERFDILGEYNTATYRFVANAAGKYLITASAAFSRTSAAAGENIRLLVFINGVYYSNLAFFELPTASSSARTYCINGSLVVPLAATDYVQIYVIANASNWNLDASTATGYGSFGITKL